MIKNEEVDDVESIKECELNFKKGKYITCLNYLEKLSDNLTKLPSKYLSNKLKNFNDHKTNILFSQWCVKHNILLCKLLSKTDEDKSSDSVADCSQYNKNRTDKSILEQLQHLRYQVRGVPLIKESLILELTISYNWLNFLLLRDNNETNSYSKNEVWMEIITTIIQIFYVATGTELTLAEYDITTAFSLIKGILQHLNQINEEKKIILLLFCNIAWFLIQHLDNKNALSLLESVIPYLESYESCNNKTERVQFCWNTSTSVLLIEEWQDIIIITYIYCLLIDNKPEKALAQFELLKETYRIAFIQYLKAISYFKTGKISEAINVAHEVWKKQHNCIENWLKAKICNLLGCCFSLVGKHHVAKEWFSQAIDEDDSFYLPLKNICVEFQLLKQYSREIESIQLLVKATANNNHKLFQSADVNHLESLYMIAKRLLDNDQYEKSAEWFKHLLSILENKNENQTCTQYNGPFMKLRTIYQQAAYAYLRSKNYNKCVEVCTKLIENYFPKDCLSEEINSQHNHNVETEMYVDDENTARKLENMPSDIISLMLRSSAYYHLDEKERALSDLKKARITLQNKSDSQIKTDISNPTKKIKIENKGNEEINKTSTENSPIKILISQVFNNLGVHCVLQKCHEEAIRLFRISLTCYPGNIDAAYNSSSLIAVLKHKEEAVHSWIKFKKESEKFNYLTSLTTEQIQSFEEIIKCSKIEEFPPKLIISDRLSFSPSTYSIELGSIHLLKEIYIPLYISLD